MLGSLKLMNRLGSYTMTFRFNKVVMCLCFDITRIS